MARSVKVLALAAGLAAGLILLAVLLLTLFFPADLIRQQIVAQIERETGRPATIEKASVALFPSPRATVRGIAIGEQAERGKPRITAQSIDLRMRLLPLLQRRVEVTRIEIRKPFVEILAGEPEVPPGTAAEAASHATRPPAALPLGVQIKSLVIHEGAIRVALPDGKPLLDVGALSERLTAEAARQGIVRLSGETRVDTLRLHLPGGTVGHGLAFRLVKRLQFDIPRDSLSIETADLDASGLPISLRGGLSGLSAGRPVANLLFEGGPARVAQILGYLPVSVRANLGGVQSQGTVALRGRLQGPLTSPESSATDPGMLPVDFDLRLTIADGSLIHPQIPSPIEGIAIEARVTPSRIEVAQFRASSRNSRIEASSEILDYASRPRMSAKVDADVDLTDVAPFLPPGNITDLGGRLALQLSATGAIEDPAGMETIGAVEATGVTLRAKEMKHPLQGVAGRVLVRGTTLTLQGVGGSYGASDFAVDGTIANPQALQPGLDPPSVADADLRIRCRTLDLDDAIGDPPARRATAEEGAAAPTPAEAAYTLFRPLRGTTVVTVGLLRNKGMQARNATAVARLDQGLVRLERMDLSAFGGTVGVRGEIDYRSPSDPKFDLKIQARNVEATEILSYASEVDHLTRLGGFLNGKIDATTSMIGGFNDTLGIRMDRLTADGQLEIREAEIREHPLQLRIAEFLDAPRLRSLEIADWFQTFQIENGRVIFDRFAVRAGPIDLSASGWQSLDGGLQISMDLLLPPDLTQGIRSHLPREIADLALGPGSSQILIPVTVAGTYPTPSVSLDTQRLTASARERARERLAQERKRLEEEGKKKARGFLDEAVKSATGDTATVGEKAKEVEKEIKGALKDLFKKR